LPWILSGEKPRYRWKANGVPLTFWCSGGRAQSTASRNPPLQKDELEITQGYFIPQTADSIIIKFLPHFDGYIWSFPRCDHLSVGICGSMSSHNQTELRTHLQTFIGKQSFSTDSARFYSHVLPSPQVPTLSQRTVVGKNWALVGDAAAFVDPLTGEGLVLRHAFRRTSGQSHRRRPSADLYRLGARLFFMRTGIRGAHRSGASIADLFWARPSRRG